MQNGNKKPLSCLKNYSSLIIILIFSMVLAFLVVARYPQRFTEYHIGDIAQKNIKAPFDVVLSDDSTTIKKGEVIVREGERITKEHLERLSEIKGAIDRPYHGFIRFALIFLSLFLFILTLIEFSYKNIKKFVISQKDLIFCSLFTVFVVIIVKSLALVFESFAPEHIDGLIYIIPIFMYGMIIRIVLFAEASLIFSLIFSIVMAITFANNLIIFLYALFGSILTSYFSGRCENRNTILKAGLYTAFLISLAVLPIGLFVGHPPACLIARFGFILLNGIASSFIALGLLPIIEHVFDYTTDIKLLELANLEHPLLERMMIDAPGTYHHSIIVGNLSAAAAESIGAHPLLARVAAYYHDIGKLKMPHYFIENRKGFEDAHRSLTPTMSALIILSHVKEGVELAEEYRLGKKITDIIREHHGTSLVAYFYNRAKEMEDPQLHIVEEDNFRYPGPKPQTKEAGIVMLADAVEASSRVLEDPTPKRIEGHVQNMIEGIFLDGQLDDCELTLKDLHAIQRSFINIMIGIFHQRIEYPERAQHESVYQRLTKVNKDGQKAHQRHNRRIINIFRAHR